jgi:hypothetical protein
MLLGDRTAEGGSNTGSNFTLSRYDDTGNIIDTPLAIQRNTGKVQVNGVPLVSVMPKLLVGLTLSNDTTTPTIVLDIDVGTACSDDNTTMMLQSSASFNKVLTAGSAWTQGSGGAGIDTGTSVAVGNNTWYHVFLIMRMDTLVVDALFSTSATAPTMPSGYTKKRRIGSILTDGSAHILAFTQLCDQFLFNTPIVNYSSAAIAIASGPFNVSTPPVDVVAFVSCTVLGSPGSVVVVFQSPKTTVPVAAATNCNMAVAPGDNWSSADYNIRTSTSVISASATAALVSGFYLTTRGWTDYRGK